MSASSLNLRPCQLSTYRLPANEPGRCNDRSFGRPYCTSSIKAHHSVYAGLSAPDGNIKPFGESAELFANEHSINLRSVNLPTVVLNFLLEMSISAAIDAATNATDGWIDTLVHHAGAHGL